jgi:hypothetical protein
LTLKQHWILLLIHSVEWISLYATLLSLIRKFTSLSWMIFFPHTLKERNECVDWLIKFGATNVDSLRFGLLLFHNLIIFFLHIPPECISKGWLLLFFIIIYFPRNKKYICKFVKSLILRKKKRNGFYI